MPIRATGPRSSGSPIVCLLVWYPVLRTRVQTRGISLNWRIVAGGLAVTLLSILLMDFSVSELLVHSEFEAARWQGRVLLHHPGERNEEFLLLFSVRLYAHRCDQAVARDRGQLGSLGGKHSIFFQSVETSFETSVPHPSEDSMRHF